jgi:putative nucleotidyltransferase with HDIG domain
MRASTREFPLTALRLAELLAGQTLTALLGQSGDGSPAAVAALAAAIDARDNYTHNHSEQVVALATGVAQKLGLSPAEVGQVRDGAMLHDVGKVAIPNEILYKPGPLTAAEWEIMREHPKIGERILQRTPELRPIAPLVRHEHERWEGTGYPDGLAGRDIPIGSRIIFACDAYSAMITARPYRQPMSHAEAIDELRRGAGSQFDPAVIEMLLELLAAQDLLVAAQA